jgi:GTPase SAR1 family protein
MVVWFYIDTNGQTQGPEENIDVSKEKFVYGLITESTYVWNGNDVNQWTPLSDVQSLMTQLKKSSLKLPPPPPMPSSSDQMNNLNIKSKQQFHHNNNNHHHHQHYNNNNPFDDEEEKFEYNNNYHFDNINIKQQKPLANAKGKSNCIILMGECGSGKSTFLNYLCNYFAQLSPPNVVKFTETSANIHNNKDQMKGHTQNCCVWGPFSYNNNQYHVIDTPGLADPDGIDKDKQHVESILEFISDCDTVIGIILVINGTASRFTSNLQLAFNKISCNLPDDVLSNACVVFTNCDLSSDANFKIEMLDFLKKPQHIYVQNSYKFGYNYDLNSDEFEAQSERWKKSMKRIQTIIEYFQGKQAKITQSFRKIRDTKKQLKFQLSQIYSEISSSCKNEDMLKELQQKLATAEKTKKFNQNFKTTKQKTEKKWTACDHHNTVCRSCVKVCHEYCGLAYTPGGGDIFKGCACMSSGDKCNNCGCSHTQHHHDKKTVKDEVLTVEDIDQNMKKLFDTAVKDLNDLKSRQEQVQKSINNVKLKRQQNIDQVKHLCGELKKQCSRYNLVNELNTELTVMKSYKERATTMEEANKWQDCINQVTNLTEQWH